MKQNWERTEEKLLSYIKCFLNISSTHSHPSKFPCQGYLSQYARYIILFNMLLTKFLLILLFQFFVVRFKTIVAANLNAITQVCYFLKHLT